ncbi:MAG: 1-deoxy-D-xylulose-5-phosphate synthase [Candidatus Adiutrix intracellularis]|jgi:1-deoxy-D-xylulose-5-phosphate synthase|nr:1-deoxy-D-xylulose-5-phosphate synthase [Candidatus Adiutrix intracellularis]
MLDYHQPASLTPLLDAIDSPADLKTLPVAKLPLLAAELRREIIRVVNKNGGHLASSLGTVELIIAIHYVLNAPRDKIIFDVGHQAYAHKILTGRRNLFENLRAEGGVSGFLKRAESPYDSFDTGHSSTSVSAALGLALARDLRREDYAVLAVIGDGAMTGGMALEAMNHTGFLKKKLIIVLNDNNMSISPNVGWLSEYLSLLVTRPTYVKLRKRIKGSLNRYLPTRGGRLINFLRRFEEALKSIFTSPSIFFEPMGLCYLGPFDGHDVGTLVDVLTGAANLDRPVLLHVVTIKGKGYAPAEADPCSYHGVGRKRGEEFESYSPENATPPLISENFADVFGRLLVAEAQKNSKIIAVTAAMSEGTGLAKFFEKFPERSFDVGIAEQHAITLAAGLAEGGFRPVAVIYSSFLQRAFDQLFHDVALPNIPVLLAVDRAGLVGEDGPTHHGGLDLSYLRLLPNFTVMVPADEAELLAMLKLGLTLGSPSALRYPRGPIPAPLPGLGYPLVPGRGVLLKNGTDLTILALGPQVSEALMAASRLKAEGISARVVNMRFLKPLDRELVIAEAEKTGRILTVEENTLTGGLFGAVSETLAASRPQTLFLLRGLGLTDVPVLHASQSSQRTWCDLDAAGIIKATRILLKEDIRKFS